MFQESFKGVSKKLSKFDECFETVSRKFKAYQKSFKKALLLLSLSSQLPEQKEGLFLDKRFKIRHFMIGTSLAKKIIL